MAFDDGVCSMAKCGGTFGGTQITGGFRLFFRDTFGVESGHCVHGLLSPVAFAMSLAG